MVENWDTMAVGVKGEDGVGCESEEHLPRGSGEAGHHLAKASRSGTDAARNSLTFSLQPACRTFDLPPRRDSCLHNLSVNGPDFVKRSTQTLPICHYFLGTGGTSISKRFHVAHMTVEVKPADRGPMFFLSALASMLMSLWIHTRGQVNREVGALSFERLRFQFPYRHHTYLLKRSLGA